MDRVGKGSDSYRPPPTSPKGHVKKKPRRDGPLRAHDDTGTQHHPSPPLSSHTPSRFPHESDDRESKPHQLGGYVIQDRPTAPEFKIRGRSVGHAAKADDCDLDDVPSLTELQRVFLGAISGSFDHIRVFENYLIDTGCSPNHPASRTVPRFKGQLSRLKEVYRAMNGEIDGLINELDQSAAREQELKGELDGCRTARFKLECANRDLAQEARELRSAVSRAEVEVGRLQNEAKELTSSQISLERRYRDLVKEQARAKTESSRLEDALRSRNAELKSSAAEIRRLRGLVEGRDKQVEGLESEKSALQDLVQRREAEAEEARADVATLQALLRDKETQLSSVMAVPITPATPLAELAAFAFPAAPGTAQPPVHPAHLPRQASPPPYIKQEAPDQSTPTEATEVVLQPRAVEPLQDPTAQLYLLGAGAAHILSKLLPLESPVPSNDVLSTFLMRLGAASEGTHVTTTTNTTQPIIFWFSDDPWLQEPTSPPALHTSLEVQFAHLCLLFPFETTHPSPVDADQPQTFHLLTSLLTSLIKADHSASRRAGQAFLETMYALPRINSTPMSTNESLGPATPRTTLLGILLSELCHVLRAFRQQHQTLPPLLPLWNQSGLSGVDDSPLGRLAHLLREGDRSIETVRQGLVEACGSVFCSFSIDSTSTGCTTYAVASTRQVTGTGSTPPTTAVPTQTGTSQGIKYIGLLRCGGENSDFLMIDFSTRSLRFVDGLLAGMMPNAAEPKKFDLVISRDGEDEELFRLAAAPKDVAAFWLQVCYV